MFVAVHGCFTAHSSVNLEYVYARCACVSVCVHAQAFQVCRVKQLKVLSSRYKPYDSHHKTPDKSLYHKTTFSYSLLTPYSNTPVRWSSNY